MSDRITVEYKDNVIENLQKQDEEENGKDENNGE